MTRKDKLKPNSDSSCEQTRQITKKCNGSKPTKGKGKSMYPAFYFLLVKLT